MRYPIDWADPLNIGWCLLELKDCVAPHQEFLYCKLATDCEVVNFAKAGQPHIRFSPNQPMGENTIGSLLKDFCEAAGIQDYHKKTPHTLRQYFITCLANNPSVNDVEVAKLARHRSITSQQAYIRRSQTSHVAAVQALANPGVATVPVSVQQPNFMNQFFSTMAQAMANAVQPASSAGQSNFATHPTGGNNST